MEITLVRHGKPDLKKSGSVSAAGMREWVLAYDASRISGSPAPTVNAACQNSKLIVSSPLPRAISSLETLGVKPDFILNELSEAPLPIFNVPTIKLSPSLWLVLFRLFWLVGASSNSESCSDAKERAKSVADRLAALAHEHNRVFSMGHGIMNKLIAKELERAGWTKVTDGESGYWGTVRYALSTF
ncbi:histidine phosphatase family protein [Pseudescherichia sp.]|uniref:histidine phosphatase family protein n=1 Tax=Pseudescherichia sp. TaxID=2055881 RepID=UPI0028A03FE4|nr:histidine phosphatase family protein [Pseudescherichia sp.]